jgi:hypothetical protein
VKCGKARGYWSRRDAKNVAAGKVHTPTLTSRLFQSTCTATFTLQTPTAMAEVANEEKVS